MREEKEWLPSGKVHIISTPKGTFNIHWIIGKSGRRKEKIKRIYGDI